MVKAPSLQLMHLGQLPRQVMSKTSKMVFIITDLLLGAQQ